MSNEKQTCGRFILLGDDNLPLMNVASLELPWKDNKQDVSCIPEGTYQVEKAYSGTFGPGTFTVKDVPGRSYIRIHLGNFTSDIEGCILLGQKHSDINADGIIDVVKSKDTIDKLKALTDEFELLIITV